MLFADATLQVNRGDRIGLVGPNGAGKSTLFAIILGDSAPDAGDISKQRNLSLGYLPQETAPVGDETVIELACAITPDFVALRRAIKQWETGHPGADATDVPHDNLHDRFHELDGYGVEARAKRILAGLAFRDRDFDRPANQLSGGWVMRAHLARLLVQEPDLLMLDEPTNHLDLEALLWVQNYLKTYPGAVLLISHDREFLNNLVGSIVEIRQGRLHRYHGNYDDYLEQREAREEQLLAAYKHQEREIARLMEFVNRFRAKNTKASQAQSKLKQIERMEKIEAPTAEEPTIGFRFPQPPRSGLRVITLEDIHHAYGDHVVYAGMAFEAQRGQRIVLVGPNGAGKSTLLKILAGVVEPRRGTRTLGHNVKCGYYSQYRVENLNLERTVLEEALDTPQRLTEQSVRTLLGCFLFRGDDVFKKVKVLSGGEKSRLALVKILLDPPNLLLMDEPTTHLDMASIDALAYALDQYQGTLIFISHDVYFIRALANHVVHVQAGRLRHYPGGYQYYLDKTATEPRGTRFVEGGVTPRPHGPAADRREQKRREAEQRQVRSRARRSQQQLVSKLEAEIQELESRQTKLTAELENPATYEQPGRAAAVNRELLGIQEILATLMPQWEQEASKLAALDQELASPSAAGNAREG
ncbi:MAG TPA: ABC-F family ATP-binding cassette domain-containing protein [Methylomirabilota bacterium]|nr:ABC-F family ATP-binding cassette domain-containing protein [Methylomirabilota bacterium]